MIRPPAPMGGVPYMRRILPPTFDLECLQSFCKCPRNSLARPLARRLDLSEERSYSAAPIARTFGPPTDPIRSRDLSTDSYNKSASVQGLEVQVICIESSAHCPPTPLLAPSLLNTAVFSHWLVLHADDAPRAQSVWTSIVRRIHSRMQVTKGI